MPSTLYLIDGHALAYRTFFALTSGAGGSRWQTSSGEPTAGIFGFARVLMNILEQDKPDYIAVAFDTGKTFRDEMFPEYKATRAKMPDDLRPQIERIRQMVDAFNIPRLEMEGYEADDVLGSVAKQAASQGIGVKIITGDRDLLQLVGDHIIVNLPEGKLAENKDYVTDDDVRERFGVPAGLVVDYKGLIGDTSDNIPGVKGIGEKTAQALFEVYHSLDEIYANLDAISKPAVREKLREGRQMAYLSRDLAQIRTDLSIKLDLEQAIPTNFDPQVVEALFIELEFKSLIPKVREIRHGKAAATMVAAYAAQPAPNQQLSFFESSSAPVVQIPAPTRGLQVEIADTPEKLASLAAELKAAKVISFDTETTSTTEMQAEVVGLSFATEAGKGWYVPVGHLGGQNLPIETVVSQIREPLTDPNIKKIGHNIKYDYLILARLGIKVTPLSFDTMLAEWLVDAGSRNLGLKNLALARLNEEMTRIETLLGPKGKNQISMAQVPIEAAAPYAAADAETCLRLMPQLESDLKRDGLTKLMYEIEMPLVGVLAEMELTGVRLNVEFFHQFGKELATRMAEIEKEVYAQVGKSFNLNSTQQLSDVLFKQLSLTPPDRGRKTASGHYSTAADVLEEMRGQHPVVDLILENRELAKLKSTYIDALPLAVNPRTGRVHTSYSQVGSVTGRLSSNDPNLQNIPIRTETGRKVRNGFVADEGNLLLSVDYSQVELRIIAHIAQDLTMLEAFRQGQDIHAATAAAITGTPLEQVTKEMRRNAKATNFGLIYGMSAFGLTRSTDLTLAESERFVKSYFERFPGIKRYLEQTKRLAAEQGYVTTLLGRRRYFPALRGMLSAQLRNREEREAINAPIQGTAADIMKIAMLQIPGALKNAGLKSQMLLQVHDEIVLECPEEELRTAAQIVQQTMEQAYELSIPLSTEARFGKSWGEMKVLE